MSRSYQKHKKEYWSNLSRASRPSLANSIPPIQSFGSDKEWRPLSFSLGAQSPSTNRTTQSSTPGRRNRISTEILSDELRNIDLLGMPYTVVNGGHDISISSCIRLCEKAYAGVAIYRNTVDLLTEFSASNIYLKGGNQSSRNFIMNWLNRVNMDKLIEQFFREYYRSGNVFVYRFDGEFAEDDYRRFKSAYGAKTSVLPLRYIILDPKTIVIQSSLNFANSPISKSLTSFELASLKSPKTADDVAFLAGLPADVQEQIKRGGGNVMIPLDMKKLRALFYKKQDYEPFAIPLGYPVLKDMDTKLEFKKQDRAIIRATENMILLVTMGAKPEEGGINMKAIEAMQEIFKSETIGRILVSDYTTKAQFIVPSIGEILDPKKYQIINEDIKDGLHNILVGSEKFSNQLTKVKIFVERLNEGRKILVNEFLQPEIKILCQNMGFQKCPAVHFEETDMQDEIQFNRIYTRLMELGVLHPDQGFRAMESGVLPDDEELRAGQTRLVEERKKGYYNPIVGGIPMIASPAAPNSEPNDPKTTPQGKPMGQSTDGRPPGSGGSPKTPSTPSPQGTSVSSLISVAQLYKTQQSISSLMETTEKKLQKRYKYKSLSPKQKELAFRITANAIQNNEMQEWETAVDEIIKDPEILIKENRETVVANAVHQTAYEHQLDDFAAAIVYHSRKK